VQPNNPTSTSLDFSHWAFITACPFKPIDLIFVLDGSGSEGANNFGKQLQFVVNFTNQFEIGDNNTRVGLLTFATAVHTEFYLDAVHDNATLQKKILAANYPNGETNTHLGRSGFFPHHL